MEQGDQMTALYSRQEDWVTSEMGWGGHKTGMVAGNYWLYLSVSLGHLAKGVSSSRAKDRLSGVVITITFVARNPGLTGCQFTNPRLGNTYNATLVMT